MLSTKRLILLLLFSSLFFNGCIFKPKTWFQKETVRNENIETLRDPFFQNVVRIDNDQDGFIDETQYKHAGVVIMIEYDYDQDGKIDEVRHFEGDRLRRANKLPDSWSYHGNASNLDVAHPEWETTNMPPRPDFTDHGFSPLDDMDVSGFRGETEPQPVALNTPADTDSTLESYPVKTPTDTAEPTATIQQPEVAKPWTSPIQTSLQEPTPGRELSRLFAMRGNHEKALATVEGDFDAVAYFTRGQNFYLHGSAAQLKDGSTLIVHAKHNRRLIFSTKVNVKQGKFEKFVKGWNKQLDAGSYTIVFEFHKTSPYNSQLYADSNDEIKDYYVREYSLQLASVTNEQLTRSYSMNTQSQGDSEVTANDTTSQPVVSQPESTTIIPDEIVATTTPHDVTPDEDGMADFFIDVNLQLKRVKGGGRLFYLTGATNLPDKAELIISMMFEDNLFSQDLVTVNSGQFTLVHDIKEGKNCGYGRYISRAEFNLGSQPESVSKLFLMHEGFVSGDGEFFLGTPAMAKDRFSLQVNRYLEEASTLSKIIKLVDANLQSQMKTLDLTTWNATIEEADQALNKIISKMGLEASRELALAFPHLNTNVRRSAFAMQDFLIAAEYKLYSGHSLNVTDSPRLQTLREALKDFEYVQQRAQSAISNLNHNLDAETKTLQSNR